MVKVSLNGYIKQKLIEKFDVNLISENSSRGCILEVDLLNILMNYMNCIIIIH